jgi:hypothetical protein
VVWGIAPAKLLAQAGVPPDFASQARLRYIHRAVGEVDLYFVANPLPHAVQAAGKFRVSGKRPELWWPDTGRCEAAAGFQEQAGITSVLLTLEPSGSVFVVFRPNAAPVDSVVGLIRNGVPLWSTAETAPDLRVQKAVYGVPDDAQRTRDVTAKVQQLVDGGERQFAVARLAEGDDPAEGIVKTLVIEYALDGRPFRVTGQDPDTVRLGDTAPKIVIEKAVYGVLDDPKRTRDVRAKVQHIVDTGERSFEVARLAQGDDPAFLVVKTLVMDFSIGGKPYKVTGTDPDTIYLAPPAAAERVAEVRAQPGKGWLFEAWQPGRYTLQTAAGRTLSVEAPTVPTVSELDGPWAVRFAPNWGAPERIRLDKLISWSEHSDPGVKYFSGAATYSKTFEMPPGLLKRNRRLTLDLGKVQVMAQVTLNGQDLGVFWKPPFEVDVSKAAKRGANALQVKVVNLWVNRMIGDEQLPEDSQRNADGTLREWPQWLQEDRPSPSGRRTFTSWRLWKKDAPLQESGLLGPVVLRAGERMVVRSGTAR